MRLIDSYDMIVQCLAAHESMENLHQSGPTVITRLCSKRHDVGHTLVVGAFAWGQSQRARSLHAWFVKADLPTPLGFWASELVTLLAFPLVLLWVVTLHQCMPV